jgi:hypothetical protein
MLEGETSDSEAKTSLPQPEKKICIDSPDSKSRTSLFLADSDYLEAASSVRRTTVSRLGFTNTEVVPTYRCPKFWVSEKSVAAVFGTSVFSELQTKVPKALEIRKENFCQQPGFTFGYAGEAELFEDYFRLFPEVHRRVGARFGVWRGSLELGGSWSTRASLS